MENNSKTIQQLTDTTINTHTKYLDAILPLNIISSNTLKESHIQSNTNIISSKPIESIQQNTKKKEL